MRAAVITVSDSCFRGQRVDVSGPVVVELLQANAFQVISHLVVPDEQADIEDALRAAIRGRESGGHDRRYRRSPSRRHPGGHHGPSATGC